MAAAVAIVLAGLISGCTSGSSASLSSAAKPAATTKVATPAPRPSTNGDIAVKAPGFDELAESLAANGHLDASDLSQLSQLGFKGLHTTAGWLADNGAIAIAPFGRYCVVAIYGMDATTVELSVMSRYNRVALNTMRYGLSYNKAKAWLAGYEPVCDGETKFLPSKPRATQAT